MLNRFRIALAAALVVTTTGTAAQTAAAQALPTFADALASAWARHPASRSADLARETVAAQRAAATRWLAEPASLGLGYRADKPLGSGPGAREADAEIALPLWRPGQREAVQHVADAAAEQLDRRLQAQRLQLAGEVRDTGWEARLARTEVELATAQLNSASALANDVERRVKAGDLARVDLNQARSVQQAARIALGHAQALQSSSLRQWVTLTGLSVLPELAEDVERTIAIAIATATATATPTTSTTTAPGSQAANDVVLPTHPALAALQARAALAAATAGKARAGRYASPEVSIALTRERGATGDPYGRTARIGLRIPLGSHSGAQVDMLQALTERAEIDAELALQTHQLAAAQALARQDLQRRAEALRWAEERLRLADDTLALQQRAFQLGHIDLPTRLRVQAERADAELQTARAGIELQRAASRLNQALGLLP